MQGVPDFLGKQNPSCWSPARASGIVRTMNQKADHPFAILARDFLPKQTSGRLARMADVNQRVAQRWLSGDLEAPADIVARLQAQQALLQQFHPGAEMTLLISRAYDAGLDTEVTGAFISAAYEILL